jgi:hypothetical protein
MHDQSVQPHSPYQGDANGGVWSPIRPSEHQDHHRNMYIKAWERQTEENDLNINLKEPHEYWGESKGSEPSDVYKIKAQTNLGLWSI